MPWIAGLRQECADGVVATLKEQWASGDMTGVTIASMYTFAHETDLLHEMMSKELPGAVFEVVAEVSPRESGSMFRTQFYLRPRVKM